MTLLRTMLTLASIATLFACASDIDTESAAFRIYAHPGPLTTEAELRRDFGPPTTERAVEAGLTPDSCRPPAVRILTYAQKFKGLAKLIQDTFHLSPNQFTIVCVDKDGAITNVSGLIVD